MPSEITDSADASRFEIRVDGELAGFAAYHLRGEQISFTHTEIEKRFGGKGLGTELIARALDDAASKGLSVLPFCPFVKDYIAEHAELVELVPADRRADFGLDGADA